MSGTFALIEKKVDRDGSCLAYKTYDKSHGKMVLLHCQRELWALKKLQSVSRETLIQQHVRQQKIKKEDCLQLFADRQCCIGHPSVRLSRD